MAKNEYVINYTTENIKLDSEQHTDILAKKFFDTFTAILSNNESENSHKSRMSKEQIA